MNETQILAHILAGEAMSCAFPALIAISYMYMENRNRNFYGWAEPDAQTWWISYTYWQFNDPAPGARFMFSTSDHQLASVQRILATRGPPVYISQPCANGQRLYFYP